ncbi:SDR family NAD(P)-dependent oxidoreductase [Halorientalis regularis]|uniref:3-oxoacyl-[acyl-carrier protein] reductase n=1 Tax=Halorientalis regularis TaxID=660518 RepID=A0A1G7N878_9EURY|nr:glucose 1-dehydrogenase [Halorientalis regularis]SDF70253.1 3-oxoacyl-[acyl-carrier protein] reductase [Halorientalis regularis]
MPVALVTGSSRGIGRAIARQYAADGCDVVLNYNTSERTAEAAVDEVEAATDSEVVAIQANVGDPVAATDLVDEAVDAFGGLDHVVNNAAINEHVYTPDLSPDAFANVLNVNVTGAFTVTKAALPHLQDSAATPGPSVVNVASRLAFDGAAYECHYAASKAAVVGLTRSHAREFAPEIRVNCVAPGYVETDMTDATNDAEDKRERRELIPVGRLGQPEDVAEAAAYLRDAGYVTGETLQVNGGQLMR